MSQYIYVALDSRGKEMRGSLNVGSQSEAIRRIKELGFFPTKVASARAKPKKRSAAGEEEAQPPPGARSKSGLRRDFRISIPFLKGGVKPKALTAFTRQLATLVDAGMPLLRGLKILAEEETNPRLRAVTEELMVSIEGGASLSESMARHPRVFNKLYVNMIKAGELGGVLEVVLNRLAEFLEKAQRIKGKVISGMFYPVAVLTVAVAILSLLMIYVVPKFQEIFADLAEGRAMPKFTLLVLQISQTLREHLGATVGCAIAGLVLFRAFTATGFGRHAVDRGKLRMPLLGPVFRKLAIARFARTFGTLISSGVPVLQALTIVRETAGNTVVARAVGAVHESVKEGETISTPLRASGVFPGTVVGMIDIGEQSGALPEMLSRIADNYDEEVDNAVAGMVSLLEPIMIVFLALIVGSIVIALFLPILDLINNGI